MVACIGMEYDYPLRVSVGKSNVVHAAKMIKRKAYDRTRLNLTTGKYEVFEHLPEREELITACVTYTGTGKKYIPVDQSVEITCKNCLRKMMGHEKVKQDVYRYVLQEKESDYFYKKQGWKNTWVADFRTATMYKSEHAAASKGRRSYYESKTGRKELTHDEYRALSQNEKQNYAFRRVVDRERYVVRRVRMELE